MCKIKDTGLDEQYVAFSLIDCETFVARLYEEEIITANEYEVLTNTLTRIANRCGLKKEND